MLTVSVKSKPGRDLELILDLLASDIPGVVAPLFHIEGREKHDGGVSEEEIIMEFTTRSPRDRNPNDIQITVRAHIYPGRLARIRAIETALKQGVKGIIPYHARNMRVGIEIDLVEMAYATIRNTRLE